MTRLLRVLCWLGLHDWYHAGILGQVRTCRRPGCRAVRLH